MAKAPSTARRSWLMKSEPEVYSIDDLARDRRTLWTGIRNYQARNFMTREMSVGDLAIFYHSNADPAGVAGLMRISGAAVADPSQFERRGDGYEPRATVERPVWHCVEVEFVSRAPRFVPLSELRSEPTLAKMELLRKGSRLSIQPVTERELARILALAGIASR